MEARTVNSLPTAAPHHDVVRCHLAIELSKASWIVAVHTPLSDKISRYTLEGCDWKSLLELVERIRKRVTREFGPSVEMRTRNQPLAIARLPAALARLLFRLGVGHDGPFPVCLSISKR